MKLDKILSSINLADDLDEQTLNDIASDCIEGYNADVDSRSEWKEKMSKAMKLALQVMEHKSDPWPKASNVKFPLITIAAMQYHARVYPALLGGTEIVKCRTIGNDPEGAKAQRADRVSKHMSYQLLEQDDNWEGEMDKLFIALPIMGSMFKKTYFDPEKGHNVSYVILPHNLVINYYATSLEDAERVTEVIQMSSRVLTEKQRLGIYRKCELVTPQSPMPTDAEIREGRVPPQGEPPHQILEQHCFIDLDEDGYAEPYIVTLDKDNSKILRIVPRFDVDSIMPSIHKDEEVGKIIPDNYYTKYTFIPSPDGGFYELGFGVLLGPINESINTLLNQLIDAGSLSNLPAVFLGRNARLKKGNMRPKPGEFINVNATGDDLRKSIVPLPFGEPSAVLFNLLQLLISYGERTSSVTDIMTGEMPGQNTPATTSVQQLEQSQKVFTGIYKRNYRDMKSEFRKLYALNAKYLDAEEYFIVIDDGQDASIYQEDYQGDPTDIRPGADPSMASKQDKVAQAQLVVAAASQAPGYNMYAVQKRFLMAAEIPNIEEVLPDPQGPNAIPQEPPLADQATMMDAETNQLLAQIKGMLAEAELSHIETKGIKNIADAESKEAGIQLDMYSKQLDEIKLDLEARKQQREENAQANAGRAGAVEGEPSN